MKISELLEAKAEPSPEIQNAYSLLKKLKVRYIRNIKDLEYSLKSGASANVGKAKSIWRGNNGAPEGPLLFLQLEKDSDIYDFDEFQVKRSAGLTLDQALEVFKGAGFKHKKTLRKVFG